MLTPIHQKFVEHKNVVESELGEPLSVTGLTGPLRIFQRVKGHRHSLDDTTTAWYALQKSPTASSVLDLGTGVGTVGLVVLWGLGSHASLTCVEAQEVSYKLLKANIECNGLQERVNAIHGDIRELNLNRKFPLITGSPPYFPRNAGVLPEDSQKAHARFELRGDVGDYARAAKRHLEDGGVFVFCYPFPQKCRGIQLVQDAGFKIASVRDVVPRLGKAPLFSLYSARLDSDKPTEHEPPFVVMDDEGRHTTEMQAMQRSRGFGPDGTNLIN